MGRGGKGKNPDAGRPRAGVELGGALKNVLAIACGINDGLGFGCNGRAALITRGLSEMTRLAVALGAHPLTMGGLAGMGDLVLTCTGDLSRNRTVGLRIGKGARALKPERYLRQAHAPRVVLCVKTRSWALRLDPNWRKLVHLCRHQLKLPDSQVMPYRARTRVACARCAQARSLRTSSRA